MTAATAATAVTVGTEEALAYRHGAMHIAAPEMICLRMQLGRHISNDRAAPAGLGIAASGPGECHMRWNLQRRS